MPQLRPAAAAEREPFAPLPEPRMAASAPAPASRKLEPAALLRPDLHAPEAEKYLQLPLPIAAAAFPSDPRLASALALRGERMLAAAMDAALVLFASALFALVCWMALGRPDLALAPRALRHWLPACAVVPALLAALYLLLCAHCGGATIGLRWRGLRIAGADGPADAAACRRRGWALLVSLGSLGLGFAWIFCDPHGLSWHDAISRTFVALDSSNPLPSSRREP